MFRWVSLIYNPFAPFPSALSTRTSVLPPLDSAFGWAPVLVSITGSNSKCLPPPLEGCGHTDLLGQLH